MPFPTLVPRIAPLSLRRSAQETEKEEEIGKVKPPCSYERRARPWDWLPCDLDASNHQRGYLQDSSTQRQPSSLYLALLPCQGDRTLHASCTVCAGPGASSRPARGHWDDFGFFPPAVCLVRLAKATESGWKGTASLHAQTFSGAYSIQWKAHVVG